MEAKQQIQGVHLYLLLMAIALISFLISLDGFIVNVAIPTISGELGVREEIGTWIITLFAMTSALFVPVSGYLSNRFGNVSLFLFGVIFFSIASLLSGLANNFSFLLFTRVLQGAGAGLLVPVSLSMIITHFPPDKKGVAVGFWSFFVMVGPVMGPMIGGWLSDAYWHWMFLLNIPICLFSLAIVYILLGNEKEETNLFSIDWGGISLLFIWVAALQVATNRWNVDDWFSSPLIVSLFIVAGLAFLLFVVWEIFNPAPFINFSQFKKRNFILPTLTTGIGMGVLFSSFVLDSLWVQKVLGYTPAWAGLTLSPVGIFPLIFYPLIGRFVSLLDLRIWVISSFILYACTFFWLSRINTHVAFWQLALPRLVQGIGFAFFTVPNALLVVRGVKPNHLTKVISLFSFMRMLFVGFGVALAVTLWIFREAFYQTRLTARVFANNPLFENLLSPIDTISDSVHQSFAIAYNILVAKAWTLALADIYLLYAWIFIALCFIVLFYKKI